MDAIGSGNGLAPTRQQAIACTIVDYDLWHDTAALGHNELV